MFKNTDQTPLLSLPLWHGLTCVLNMIDQFVIVLGEGWAIIHPYQVTLTQLHVNSYMKKVMADTKEEACCSCKRFIGIMFHRHNSFLSVACMQDWAVSMPLSSISSLSQCLVPSVVSLIKLFTILNLSVHNICTISQSIIIIRYFWFRKLNYFY